MTRPIILGSTSPFRKAILEKLAIPFVCCAPDVDESARNNEQPKDLVERLAIEKAQAVAKNYQHGLVIGSDQLAVVDGMVLGKPHSHEKAVTQLKNSSGKVVTFYTGLCLLDVESGAYQSLVEPFEVHFRTLTDAEIEHYLKLETPYKCAGSFKSEAAGISLFKKLVGDDPNTLMGMPLIRLIELLRNQGVDVLALANEHNGNR
ncbi:septum formation inhibitor Maf [Neiella sp. HB171785]|uniref:7-methyl-GTP pyrophosphatase n=1 Tax=Neiella litorisoli TaxID=2771431 RepID=A0A8J6QH87_9GAMM|nr:nucleoside triphosphate pyrophosphatase [Neiella litorisoli]MBD1388452.1 septum formation inhibitor Maf [Neiella litorisoli]